MINPFSSFSEFVFLSIILIIKMWASWEAAKRDDTWWFISFFLIWFYAIPELIYLFWFRKKLHFF